MNYLKLATHDYLGAGLASVKRVEALRNRGINAKLIVFEKRSTNEHVVGLLDRNKKVDTFLLKVLRVLRTWYKGNRIKEINPRYYYYNIELNIISARKILKMYGAKPDIIDVSWVTDFISARTVNKLQRLTGAKIVYVMTDNAPITGGCHYPWACKGFTATCYPCPALQPGSHLAEKTLAKRKRYIKPDMIITGTTSDCNRARVSTLFKEAIIVPSAQVRPNPYRFPKEAGRKRWAIDAHRYVVFCGASFINEERKGFHLLIEAINLMNQRGDDLSTVTFLVAGSEQLVFPPNLDVRMVGKLDEEALFMAYDCSDLFVSPSLEDSGPMMMNYAFKAYLPVVCFPTGISLDLIEHKTNGYVAAWGDAADYAAGLLFCMEHRQTIEAHIHEVNDRIEQYIKQHCSIDTYLGLE
ncbi:MAG: glycosyltransferase [Bacteroidales bacterium]|jgi:glycosyltransferase involved in cell wall biosynthesis|nr:glycosyltransferase [Bacteroidales bacterium]